MIRRIRLLVVMARPAVLLMLCVFANTGFAQAGGSHRLPLAQALAAVVGFLLFSVAVNDLADEAIDRVNLPADRSRPLVAGTGYRREMATIAVASGAVALAASVPLGWPAVGVLAAGLALSAGYSVRPVRLADRGAVASMLLPACYVAVPYLVGLLAARPSVHRAGPLVHRADVVLLAGLYLGFIGRILLKDFRDVRGDALFGKRTFLVRHGRRPTCALSGGCWVAGSVVLLAGLRPAAPALVAGYAVAAAGALWLLRELAGNPGPRREERLVSAIAIVGRGQLLALLAQLSMRQAGWPALAAAAVIAALAAIVAGQARAMLHYGPVTPRVVLPECSAVPAVQGTKPKEELP